MKIIFLDFDGVLNSQEALDEQARETGKWPVEWIDFRLVNRINQIIQATEAKVVISSAWRVFYSLEWLEDFLQKNSFTGEILGSTPRMGDYPERRLACRGDEIEEWLKVWNAPPTISPVDKFIILDDDDDMGNLMQYLVQTDFETGIQDKQVQRAIEILNG